MHGHHNGIVGLYHHDVEFNCRCDIRADRNPIFCSNRLEVCMCARMTSSIHVSDGVIYASMKHPDGKINIRADQCSVGKSQSFT